MSVVTGYRIKEAIITVEYSEDTIQGGISTDRIIFTRTFRCTWENRFILCRDLMGWTEIEDSTYVIHLPHRYQPEGIMGEIRCAEIIDIRGFGGLVESPADEAMAEYEQAIIVARYSTPEFDIITNNPEIPLISESIEPVAEYITLNHKNLYWDSAQQYPVEVFEAPSMIIRKWDWVYRIHKAARVPGALLDRIGTCNQYEVYSRSLDRTFLPETLLLGNPSMSREHTSLGITMFTVTVRLTVFPPGWNTFPRANELDGNKNITWSRVYNKNGVLAYPYPLSDWREVII